MNRKYKLISIFAIVFSLFYVTFGYAAYSQDLTISDISATFRQPLDVRVTNFYLLNSENGGYSENDDFNGNVIFSDMVLPENATVTYNIEFSSYDNHSAYLIDIEGIPENLKYEIDEGISNKYKLKDLMFSSEQQTKEITLTFSYKENGYDPSNIFYDLNIKFYFDSSYTVAFNDSDIVLPFEYQRVEYLESTGTQYIDTSYLPNDLTNLESSFMYHDLSELSSPFGVREVNESVKQFLVSTTADNVLWIVNGINNQAISNIHPKINEKYTVKITPSAAYWNDSKILDMNNALAKIDKMSMYLFGRNTTDGFSTPLKGKMYYLKITEGDNLIRNFVPCYKKTDNVAGMYDTQEKKFYENKGSGVFLIGPEVYDKNYQTILLGQNERLNKNIFTKKHHVFTGWNTKIDGTGKHYADQSIVYNLADADEIIDLYSQWRPYQLIVRFNANGGLGKMADFKIPYLNSSNLPENTYKNKGNLFLGWNTKTDGSGLQYLDKNKIYNNYDNDGSIINLYAQWLSLSLPSEYQAVDYIESNGKQYIDTLYFPNSDTTVESKFMYNKIVETTSPFGVRELNQSRRQFLISTTSDRVLWVVNGLNDLSFSDILPKENEEYIVKITPTEAFWNGNKLADLKNETANVTERSMYMFGRNTTSGFSTPLYGKIYYMKIFKNGELIKYFIPCYRKNDNVVGMYDLIENKFYLNSGTGNFVRGNDITLDK